MSDPQVPQGAPAPPDLSALLAGYARMPGVADEMMGPDGRPRPLWAPFLAHLAAQGPEALAARFRRGDQSLRDAGVFFRHYGPEGSIERDWPLSHVPVILHDLEWQGIEAALIQRADLLEQVMADLYGPARLVADGHLPAALVARNREWLRPMVGVAPRGGHHLHFIAFDIARNPDGSWFVLGDRTQAPSGAGFALENRVATARVFPEQIKAGNVHRLAGFFRGFREALNALRRNPDGRVAILTPGPLNDTYFEHAYLARYLGFMLLEGEDLVVQDDQVLVRTVSGLHPVEVIWRRLDSNFADPLELDPRSRIGTPGLVGALRAGKLTAVNQPGSGLLETRGFLAFLPRICEALRGEPLMMPNIATWWCGQAAERAYVLDNAARLTIGPALANRLPFEADQPVVVSGPVVPGDADLPLADWIARDGDELVGQESVRLSTSPAWVGEGLAPRPVSLRVFLARTPEGWSVMKGGYARIGRTEDTSAIAMQRGGAVADVWIAAGAPVPQVSMVAAGGIAPRPFRSSLPSRAADNLLWLGRYVERAEAAARMLRAWHLRLAETGSADSPLLVALADHLAQHGIAAETGFAEALGLRLNQARGCAGRLRDRLSGDALQALASLSDSATALAGLAPGDDAARGLGRMLRQIAGLTGLVHENMYRFTGWRFLTIGRALERADAMAWGLLRFADPGAPEGSLDLLLELGDSAMTHRRRYAVSTSRDTLVELLCLDGLNPRSVRYQLAELRGQLELLPGENEGGPVSPLRRRVLLSHTQLAVLRPDEVTPEALATLRAEIASIPGLLAERYFP